MTIFGESTEDVVATMQRIAVDQGAKARVIAEANGVEKNVVMYHLREHLIPGGFVKVSGSVDEGYPRSTQLFKLTEDGQNLDVTSTATSSEHLQERVEELEAEVATLRAELNNERESQQEQLEEMHQKWNQLLDHVDEALEKS